jgi:DNA repair photolyase
MSLKKSKGNMYDWLSHVHSHLGGECPHKCKYCYVNHPVSGRPAKFTGPVKLIEEEFKVNYGEGKTIFIEHCNDLFAADVDWKIITRVIDHCRAWPLNTYMFQTKNPARFEQCFDIIPDGSIVGTTIETNRVIPDISLAPPPEERANAMAKIRERCGFKVFKLFVTVEPILDFDVDKLAEWMGRISPDFLNIGADSKGHGLPEPTVEKVLEFVAVLKDRHGIEVRKKRNLERLTSLGSRA